MPQPLVQNPAQIQGFENAPRDVRRAVADASARTGVDFSYLMHKAAAESSFRVDAAAKTSSAKGLYQFIDQTWLAMVDRYGAKHGLGQHANAIERGGDGRYRITDASQRDTIMDLRFDPKAAANMAAEFAGENQRHLESKLDRDLGATDLYLAHFLGAGGASTFLQEMERNPAANAAQLMPKAAAANRNVFYDRSTGQPRSVSEVYDFFAGKFDESGATTVVASRPERSGQNYSGGVNGFNWSASPSRHSAGVSRLEGDDAIIRQLIQALNGDNSGFRSVADAINGKNPLDRSLFATDLLLMAQQSI
ncbi:MAG: lytic transglycosylase domain-containing protein [Pseudomonadota bacterium]